MSAMPDATVPVLLDTDIGSDIDDAVALAYLLAQPRCELVGITTVTGNTAARAACAGALCEAAGRRAVPIHAGLSTPLLHGAGQPDVPQYAAIEAHQPVDSTACDAIDFMREAIRARPGEIELLTVGPLTNVAVLFALDPEIPPLLRGFTSMAGVYRDSQRTYGEWNVVVDPAAAAVAFRRAPDGHRCVGLDVTRQVRMPRDDFEQAFSTTPLLRVVLDMASVWFERVEHVTFHDPLAAALVFEPSLCSLEPGKVAIAYGPDPPVPGATNFTPDPSGRHRVAVAVDVEAFFAEYLGRVAPI